MGRVAGCPYHATFRDLALGGIWIPLLYIASYTSPLVRGALGNIWITRVGGMCYSIYLIHNYAIAGLGFLAGSVGTAYPFSARLALQFVLLTPGVIVICALYFRFVERPCMDPNWPDKLVRWYRRWAPAPLSLTRHRF